MSSYPVPAEQEKLIRAVLRSIFADHYPEESNPHADAESEYAAEQVAIAARDLTDAVNTLDPNRRPIGWHKLGDLKPAGPAKPAMTWTGPDGTVYDLGHGLRDADGDVWICQGWFQPFDGDPVPVMVWGDEQPCHITEVIERYGPLAKRAED